MKKLFGMIALVTMLIFVTTNADAQGRNGKGNNNGGNHGTVNFVDADGDGICDNFVDEDGDGKCDHCTGLGTGFIDEDGDGNCDNQGTGNMGSGNGQGQGGKGKGMNGEGKRLRDGSCDFELEQNYPNPVNGNTSLNLNVSEAKYGIINLYDYSGNKVAEVFKGDLNSGDNLIDYQPVNMKSGVYYYSVEIDGQISTKKMIIK
ncbi:MAG: T9SS type A sorting domain-containing protein [bacterium]